jgi:murein L,D-transpeptidase YcbB/YkuD
MQTLVFSPYWNVPASILKDEVIPELDKDPDYLARKNMEVVRAGVPVDEGEDLSFEDDPTLRVRQKPGAGNALGHVKFLFPNEFDVYLHDTPLDTLFVRRARGFSHGCVRIEKPFELAQWVLKDRPEWTPEKIDAAMNSGTERHVALKRKVPVYILYRTVWVDDDGSVRFANDLYGHDKRQLRLLASR